MQALNGLKKYKKKFNWNLLNLTCWSLILSALTQCVAIGIGNVFLVLSLFLSFIYVYYNHDLVLSRIRRFKTFFIFYLIFLGCLLPSVIFSPDVLYSTGKIIRIFLYRSSPFLIVMLVCPQNKYTLLLILLSLISFVITSVGGFLLIHEGTWRIRGLFGHQMTLAGFLCLIGPLVFCLLYSKSANFRKRLIYILLFIFTVFILLMNGTRGAWISLFICLLIIGVWFCVKSKRNLIILAIFCIGVATCIGSSDRLSERLATVTSTSFASNVERLAMWKTAFKIWEDHPLVGVGYYRYQKVYQTQYAPKDAPYRGYAHPHNNLLFLLADSGFFGFLGYCLFFGYILIFSFCKLRKTNNLYYLLIFTTTLSLQLQGLTEYNFGNQAVIKFYWMLLACYLCLAENNYRKFPV